MTRRRAVLVVCDGLRADMLNPKLTPNICRTAALGTRFSEHRGVFPSTTRTTSASIATGCYPARHGLEGNCVALDEGEGLVAMSVGPAAFRDRLERATGRTLRVPTLAQRLADDGGSILFSNVSPGAAIFHDPDGHGWMYHRVLGYGPGRKPVTDEDALSISHDAEGDEQMTRRFVDEVLCARRPALSVLWLCEPDHSQHAHPLGSPAHLQAIMQADANVGRVVDFLQRDTAEEETLVIVASDHGHESVEGVVDLEALLIEGGFKAGPDSHELVVASNGLSASIYLEEPLPEKVTAIENFLRAEPRIGSVLSGADLARTGQCCDGKLAIAVTGATSDVNNAYGVPGRTYAFADPLSSDTEVGCGQHGGLGRYEQAPFLVIWGAGFNADTVDTRETSAVDLAPTIAEHLGIDASGMDGRPLQPQATI